MLDLAPFNPSTATTCAALPSARQAADAGLIHIVESRIAGNFADFCAANDVFCCETLMEVYTRSLRRGCIVKMK
jgi:hypothetical protein